MQTKQITIETKPTNLLTTLGNIALITFMAVSLSFVVYALTIQVITLINAI